jgi:hypothetical protein
MIGIWNKGKIKVLPVAELETCSEIPALSNRFRPLDNRCAITPETIRLASRGDVLADRS